MIKLGPGVFAPVFCNGTEWVREDLMPMSQCKVCIACKQKNNINKTDDHARRGGSWQGGVCDYPDDDGWAVARDFLSGCGSNGNNSDGQGGTRTRGINLAIKFVCGPDKAAGRFPQPYWFGREVGPDGWGPNWQYHPSDQTNQKEYVIGYDK